MPVLLRNARVITCDGPPGAPLGELAPGAVLIDDGAIHWVGRDDDRPRGTAGAGEIQELDLDGRLVTPGLVDCHTHAVFAGERSREFALRAAGTSYLDIAAAGGGIVASTAPTRAATDGELREQAAHRLHLALRAGTTTIEVKSGYDLTIDGELRLLRVITGLAAERRQRVVPTLLCHVVPAERKADRDAYVRALADELIPRVAAESLATSVDIYCDDGAFTLAETRTVLTAAKAAGLAVRGHAGQFADLGAAELLAELGAVSADHLEQVSDAGIAALAAAGTIAVMLPGACVQLKLPPPPVAKLRAAGVAMAIATDLNPGSSWAQSLAPQLWLATTHYGMTVDEAWLGVTRHAATALGLGAAAGTIAVGRRADLVVWSCEHPAEVPYRYDSRLVSSVWVAGDQAVIAPDEYRWKREP